MNYEKIYNQIIERAKSRMLEGYGEKHHVIPKCLGGSNDKSNIVKLTAREHFICHRLLHKVHPKNNKLAWAFIMMCRVYNDKQNRYTPSSRVFEEARLLIIQSNKELGKKKKGKRYPKISQSKLGHKPTEESKKHMSEAAINMSSEKRQNINNAHYARRGSFWVNDGNTSKQLHLGESLPVGYSLGRLYTPSEENRLRHSLIMKGRRVGESNPSAKRVGQYTKDGELINVYHTIREAEKITNIKKIGAIANGHRTHRIYVFKFI